MSAQILDGRALSERVKKGVNERAIQFFARNGRKPGLAVILVGNNPASEVYVRNKTIACGQNNICSTTYYLEETVSERTLLDLIKFLNDDSRFDAILVQLPLPPHIRQNVVLSKISHRKDADGFLAQNAGNLMLGNPSLNACTPCGVMDLIKETGIDIAGKQAVVVGRSNIVGKPIALMLLEENATVTMCHSHTHNLGNYTRHADILVVAVGQKNVINGSMIKKGAVVIDVGMNRLNDKLCGDVDFESCLDVAGYITPVPGGVGPMTIAMLLKNIMQAAEAIEKRRIEKGITQ